MAQPPRHDPNGDKYAKDIVHKTGGDKDEACANAGIEKVADKLK